MHLKLATKYLLNMTEEYVFLLNDIGDKYR